MLPKRANLRYSVSKPRRTAAGQAEVAELADALDLGTGFSRASECSSLQDNAPGSRLQNGKPGRQLNWRDRNTMLFPERKSGLVRLSDSVKVGLELCSDTTRKVLTVYAKGKPFYERAQAVASRAVRGEISYEEADEQATEILSTIPEDDAKTGAALQVTLHSQVLSVILMCCFCVESYINSFAYFLFQEVDFLGLIRSGRQASADALLTAIDRLSIRQKWETIGNLGTRPGLDRSRYPFQDITYLFNFRDDHVHDKAVPYAEDRATKRYNNKFPDPVFGFLDLGHGLYAATVYWDLVGEIHRVTGVDPISFHRHYNLRPWFQDENRELLAELATEYRKSFPSEV